VIYTLLIIVFLFSLFTNFSIANPFGFLFYFFGIFFILKYIHNNYYEVDYLLNINSSDIDIASKPMLIYIMIAFAVFVLIYLIKRRPLKEGNNQIYISKLAIIFSIGIPVTLIFSALILNINVLENPLMFRQYVQSNGMYYFLAVYIFFLKLYSIYIPYTYFIEHQKISKLNLLTYITLIVFSFLSGFSSFMFFFILFPLLFLSICHARRCYEFIIYFCTPIALIFVLVYSYYRDNRFYGTPVSISESFINTIENPDLFSRLFNRFDYLEMYTKGYLTLNNVFLDFKINFLTIFIQFIPRSIWPEKPLNFSSAMTADIIPENFSNGVTANFNSLNEFIYNFGVIGIIFGGFVLGFITYITYFYYKRSYLNPYASLFYLMIIFPYFSMGFVSGFLNDLALPSLLINLLLFRLFVKPRNFS
jgi:hypothetical protein